MPPREWEGEKKTHMNPSTDTQVAEQESVLTRKELRFLQRERQILDAAREILVRDSETCSGNFFIDEDVLRESGVEDFTRYSVNPGSDLQPDFFV